MSVSHAGLVAVLWVVFAVSAVSKVRGRAAQRAFADSLRPLGFVPYRWVPAVAAAVTAAEVVVLLGLSVVLAGTFGGPVGIAEWLSLGAAGVLLCVLTGGIAVALRRGTTARCACFGATERVLGGRHLARNGVLLAVVLAALATGPARPAETAAVLIAVAAGAVVATVLIRLDDVTDLFTPAPTTRN